MELAMQPSTPSSSIPAARDDTPRLRFPGSATLDAFVRANPLWVVLGLLLFGAALLWPYRHFAGDDAYITFRFARNFADGHGFSFNPDVPVYGSTAPLWVFLIAGVHRLGIDVPDAAHLLNWSFLLVNVPLFFVLARRYLGLNSALVLAAVLMLADPWFLRWSLSGMENGLALCLLMSLLLSQQQLRNGPRTNLISPLAAALAGLCRPEMCLLGVILALDIALFERRRRIRNLLATGVIYLLVLVPWLWYAETHFGSVIPTTIKAKVSGLHALASLRTLQYFTSFWAFQGIALLLAGLLVVRRKLTVAYDPAHAAQWFMPVAWAAILPAFYIAGGAPVAGRYMMFGLPCYLIIGVKAWTLLCGRYPRLVAASILSTFVLIAAVQYEYCWYVTQWPQGMDPKMIAMAKTLARESSPGAVVAGDQIGVLGYFSGRYVLDTYGLVAPEVLPYRKAADDGPLWRYVHERRPDFLFVSDTREKLARWDASFATATLVQEEDVQREGSGSVGGLITYRLYKTHW